MPTASRIPSRSAVDPRVERSRQVILQAALDELGEVGYGTFRIESVAARAGVGKSTIYRHWTDKLALIADAFETFHVQMSPTPRRGRHARTWRQWSGTWPSCSSTPPSLSAYRP